MSTAATVAQLLAVARPLYDRGLTPGTSGNVSARTDADDLLVTPTGHCMGRLVAADIARLSADGVPREGPVPSKETALHQAMYRRHPDAGAVVHLHSPYATAVSCLAGLDPADTLPALTGYHAMRVGRVPLVAYFSPGSDALVVAVDGAATEAHALLLANHGSIVAAADLESAADAAEQLEQTAHLVLLLHGRRATTVSAPDRRGAR